MVSAECTPFAKTGGLGDVVGALPQFLVQRPGTKVIIVMPLYSFIDKTKFNLKKEFSHLDVSVGGELKGCAVWKSEIPGNVPVFFIEHNHLYDRPGLYHDQFYNDYSDNPVRFIFLCKAALQLCHALNFKPDIIHAHDWHTAILPAILKRQYNEDPLYANSASVLTIHNIAYQGRYNRGYYFSSGLGWEDFTHDKFEHYGDVNFLKGGIHFADMVNTVSKGYAAETKAAPGGYGLEYSLNDKGDDYTGILNGVDYNQWNPEIDNLIPAKYSKDEMGGKAVCKEALQKQLGLELNRDVPLIGIVSRLVDQKGFHILSECIEELIREEEVQFAILGSGDKKLESFFDSLPGKFHGKAGVFIGYDNELAHLIEAGSDFFLMPSVYEPCGLNQIYSLRYGTLPIVRATGGLNDTIENYDQERGSGTGFKFQESSCKAASDTIKLALDTYYNQRQHMEKLIKNAMQQNFSWDQSANEYFELYERALGKIQKNKPRV